MWQKGRSILGREQRSTGRGLSHHGGMKGKEMVPERKESRGTQKTVTSEDASSNLRIYVRFLMN